MNPVPDAKQNTEWQQNAATYRRRVYKMNQAETLDVRTSFQAAEAMPFETGFKIARVRFEQMADGRGRLAILTGVQRWAWAGV